MHRCFLSVLLLCLIAGCDLTGSYQERINSAGSRVSGGRPAAPAPQAPADGNPPAAAPAEGAPAPAEAAPAGGGPVAPPANGS